MQLTTTRGRQWEATPRWVGSPHQHKTPVHTLTPHRVTAPGVSPSPFLPLQQTTEFSLLPPPRPSIHPSSHSFLGMETIHSGRRVPFQRCPERTPAPVAFLPCSLPPFLMEGARGTRHHKGPGPSSLPAQPLTGRLWERFLSSPAFWFSHRTRE